MASWAVLLLLIKLIMLQPSGESIMLTASREQAYAGEMIEYRLTIHTVDRSQRILEIPGLQTAEVWQLMFQSWLMGSKLTRDQGLLVRFRQGILVIPRLKKEVYELRWKSVAHSRNEEQLQRIGPVRLGTMMSPVLQLEVLALPPQPVTSQAWYLGVGRFQVSARWLSSEVTLGEETMLELQVVGTGALEAINVPPLRSMPGWEGDRLLLEVTIPTWNQGKRLFQCRVRPRQLRMPALVLFIRFFDPDRSAYITERVELPALRIVPSSQSRNTIPGSTVADARNLLPAFRMQSLDDRHPMHWARWLSWLLWIPVIWCLLIIIRWAVHQFFPQWIESLRWRMAQRWVLTQLHQPLPPAELRQVVAGYLGMGLDRTIASDLESLHRESSLAPFRLTSLLQSIQQAEFGPHRGDDYKQLVLLAQHCFAAQEVASA